MRLRAWMGTSLVAMLLVGCGRDGPDVREPLGARIVGARYPALVAQAGRPRPTVALPTASLPPATYAADQAARGAAVYHETCARCHPPGQLDGETFIIGWNERRLSDLFATLANTMPQDRPGSLSDQQYVDVIAYLLQRNRVPAGAVALRPDTNAMRQVRIAVGPAE